MPAITGYRLLRVIAEGATSVVYLAGQEALDRQVALKVMRPDALEDEVSRRRFENEIRTIGRLEHPHIVGIHHIGRTADGLPYYSMPYLPHGHLRQRDFRGDEARVREVLRGLLSALAYAHGRGVIHRDVKAENVLFDAADKPLLADFGIALRRGYGSRLTCAGLAVGSTAYMAPEQARGEEVDPRADLYSVGVLAWEMLAGELPYQAQDALAMAVMHARDPIPRLPPELRHWQRFMDRALAKGPLKRFHDAAHMLRAMEKLPGPGERLAAGHWLQRGAGGLRRVPAYAWVAAGLLAAGAVGLGLRQADPEPQAESFFRASAGEATRPRLGGPGSSATEPLVEAAAPESEAGRLIAEARAQMQARRLTAPQGGNAAESLAAALEVDPGHLELPAATAALVGLLGQDAARRVQAGDASGATVSLEHATRLANAVAPAAGAELARARAAVASAIGGQVDAAERRFDRQAALRSLEPARSLGIGTQAVGRLRARAQAIPAVGEVLPGDPARMTVRRAGRNAFALTRRMISREEYARFADATGREPALCRERISPLRVIAPRDWRSPGFDQSGSGAAVCVSWNDANAYAQWLGKRRGAHYRLPTAGEARSFPAQAGATPVAEWLLECGGDCQARAVGGDGWRGTEPGPRQAGRGYDDVGFRLVRDP